MAEQQQKVKEPAMFKSVAVRPPRMEDLAEISDELGFCCSTEELKEFRDFAEMTLKSYDVVDKMVAPRLPVKYPRTPGYQPDPADNKYNAWYWRCEINGAPEGILKGKTVAIKDSVCVAGVPMMNGSKQMEGFVPDEDASIVTKILDAGGKILGKAHCEHMCYSGTSCTNDAGPTLNPHDTARSSGGSSSGSAVLVLNGDVDMAIGGDQGGSIRMPSCWCGIVGLKPTWGLVPYTGGVPIEISCDHIGPMARTVTDCALLLEAIAGYDDGLDPRQPRDLTVPQYSNLLTGDLTGQKVGLVTEGFEHCTPGVQTQVRQAAQQLTSAGAVVEEVSIPYHAVGMDIWTPICTDGAYKCMIKGNGFGHHYKGHYPLSTLGKILQGNATMAKHTSDSLKLCCFVAAYVDKNYGNKFYAKAQNLNRLLTKAYDKAFETYDVIIMPTLPYVAPLLPKEDSTIKERLDHILGMLKNTSPFDATGHPALTINAGTSDGLPVGMMIIGGQFQETKVLNAAFAFEKIKGNAS